MGVAVDSQTPTFEVVPDGDDSDGVDAVDLAAGYGLVLDGWQSHVIRSWMRRDSFGRWCAGRWGVAVPRQNGKNAIIEAVELYGMAVLGLRFLHTAHEVKTARKAFMRILSFFKDNDDLLALVKSTRETNGQEAIFLHHADCDVSGPGRDCRCKGGGSIEFIARSKNSGRGFTVDVLVADEAQEFAEEDLAALLPTISAAPSGDPVQIILGTPPSERDNGEVFTRVHDVAHEQIDNRLAWCEWAVVGDIDESDRDLWARTNPALGGRLLWTTIEDEFNSFDRDTFARERLGLWATELNLSVIPDRDWEARRVLSAPDGEISAIGLDMNPERTVISVSVAVKREDRIHVELARTGDAGSTAELVEWIYSRARRRVPVVMDSFTPIRSIEGLLKQKKCKVYALSGNELMQACGGFYDAAVKDETVTHIGQEELDDSLRGAKRQKIGDAGGWKWSRKTLDSDLTQIMAVTCAFFGALKFARVRSERQKGRVTF